MITLDTNVLARYLLKDDPAQFEKAQAIIEGPETFAIPVTVCLELVWVLEVSDCSRAEIARAIRLLIGLPNLTVSPVEILLNALRWYEGGMDFADAMHLAMSIESEALVTFDKDFAKLSKRLEAFPDVHLV